MPTITIEDAVGGMTEEFPNRYAAIPPNGAKCEITGLGHSKLYSILRSPDGIARKSVRVVNLRQAGAKRGKTLFHVGDMLRFLDNESRKQSLRLKALPGQDCGEGSKRRRDDPLNTDQLNFIPSLENKQKEKPTIKA